MKLSFMPRTVPGRWGFWLSVAFAALFVLKVTVSFPLPSPVIFAVGIAGVVMNIIAIVKRERAIVFFVMAGVIGAFVIFWVGGELLFPH